MLWSSMSGLKRTVAIDPEGVDCAPAKVEAPTTSASATACQRCMSSSQGDFRNARVLRAMIAILDHRGHKGQEETEVFPLCSSVPSGVNDFELRQNAAS